MPLEDLFVDTQELDEELVATVLKPYLRIDPNRLAIRPQEAWKSASNKARVVAYLLARKAMRARGVMPLEDEPVAPADIISATGLPSGSVYPTLKELIEARPQVIDKEDGARYWIPDWAVQTASDLLRGTS